MRIRPLPQDQWDPAFQARPDAHPHEILSIGLMAHVPEIAKAMGGMRAAMAEHMTLPARLQELVRLRIAFHNQCRSCMAVRYKAGADAGVDEDLVCSLEKPMEAPNLTAPEKAALAYADIASTNHFAINDATFDALRVHFSEAEIVQLGLLVGMFIGFGRFSASMDLTDALPEAYRDRSVDVITPWGNAPLPVAG